MSPSSARIHRADVLSLQTGFDNRLNKQLVSGCPMSGRVAAPVTDGRCVHSAGQSIVNRLRTSLFSSILRQEVAFFDKTRTGELINRLSSDTALLGRSVTENLSDGLRAVAQASVGVGMMVCQSLLVVFSVRALRTRAGEHERLEMSLSFCKQIEMRTLPHS